MNNGLQSTTLYHFIELSVAVESNRVQILFNCSAEKRRELKSMKAVSLSNFYQPEKEWLLGDYNKLVSQLIQV